MTGRFLQKREQIRQVGEAAALAGMWAFEGCPPHYLPHTWGSFTALGLRIATTRFRIAAHTPQSQ
jgi:hypothetical protein